MCLKGNRCWNYSLYCICILLSAMAFHFYSYISCSSYAMNEWSYRRTNHSNFVFFCFSLSYSQVLVIHRREFMVRAPKCNVHYVSIKPTENQGLHLPPHSCSLWRESSGRNSTCRLPNEQSSPLRWIWLKPRWKSGSKIVAPRRNVCKKPNLRNWRWQPSQCYPPLLACPFPLRQRRRTTRPGWARCIDTTFRMAFFSRSTLRRTLRLRICPPHTHSRSRQQVSCFPINSIIELLQCRELLTRLPCI